jgi:hypothetical protein
MEKMPLWCDGWCMDSPNFPLMVEHLCVVVISKQLLFKPPSKKASGSHKGNRLYSTDMFYCKVRCAHAFLGTNDGKTHHM